MKYDFLKYETIQFKLILKFTTCLIVELCFKYFDPSQKTFIFSVTNVLLINAYLI